MKPILIAIMCLSLIGCATSGNKLLLDQSMQDSISVGTTTKQQVSALLGTPNMTTTTSIDGTKTETWGYSYTSMWTNPWLWVPVAGLVALICCETTRMEYRSLGLSFSHDGVVRSKITSRGDLSGLMTQMASQVELEVKQ